jgi:FkbM family methyltransferase
MLISVRQLGRYWAVRPKGVLHVGAHEAEELADYQAAKWTPVVWVEGLPDKGAELQERFRGTADQSAISAVAWDADGESLTMWRTNNGQSSSALPLGTHLVEHPGVWVIEELSVQSSRLDTLLQGTAHRFDFINLDIQGAELRALRGLGDRIRDLRWIYCEVNKRPLYVGAHLVGQIDAYLAPFGFRRVDTYMTPHGWGDALYVRADAMPALPWLRRATRRFVTSALKSRVGQRLSSIIR